MAENIFAIVFTVFLAFVAYSFFVVFPVMLYNESQCLSQGYPKARVTLTPDRYCIGLEGNTKTVVVSQ